MVNLVFTNTTGSGTRAGNVLSFEAADIFGPGPANTTLTVGRVRFTVTGNVATDGVDVKSGAFNPGFDVSLDNFNNVITPTFNGASVNFVPEPTAVSLVALALASAGLAARRRPRD